MRSIAPSAWRIDLGIRHVDTAQMYGNEKDVGRALAQSGHCARRALRRHQGRPRQCGRARFAIHRGAFRRGSWKPADLLLIHWPPAEAEFIAVLDRLMAEHQKGNARAIGVSNFSPRHDAPCAEAPAAVPSSTTRWSSIHCWTIRRARERRGSWALPLSAYSPLARGAAMKPAAHRRPSPNRLVGRPRKWCCGGYCSKASSRSR